MRVTFTGLFLVAACGGNVVVDAETAGAGAGQTGGGGSPATSTGKGGGAIVSVGASPSTVVVSTATGGASCGPSFPPGSLKNCGGVASAGTGNVTCAQSVCEDDGTIWDALCNGTTCTCAKNGATLCVCDQAPGSVCTAYCCPFVSGL